MHEGDGTGVAVAGSGLDHALVDHGRDDVAPQFGADDRERPVVVLADAARRDVSVLGGEVQAWHSLSGTSW